jgi:hypothetical protein
MHYSFLVFFHETIRAVALFVRSQGICQGVGDAENGDVVRFCYYGGGYKEKSAV